MSTFEKTDAPISHYSLNPHQAKVYVAKTKEEMIHAYGEWAPAYDQTSRDNDAASKRIIAKVLLDQIAPVDAAVPPTPITILDVGCGTGLPAEHLITMANERSIKLDMVGFDFCARMVQEAAKKNVYSHVFVADICNPLDLPHASFDTFIACGVFASGHVEPEELVNVTRALRPGGIGVITVRCTVWDKDHHRYCASFNAAAVDIVSDHIDKYLGPFGAHYIVLRKRI